MGIMKVLSREGRQNVSQLFEKTGIPPEACLIVISEVIVPGIDADRFRQAVLKSELAWLLLKEGESIAVDVPMGKEVRFRNRVSSVGRRVGVRYSASFDYDNGGAMIPVKVTNKGPRDGGKGSANEVEADEGSRQVGDKPVNLFD